MARESAYLPVFFGDLPTGGDLIELAGAEGQHAVRVRRVRVGESIRIADGDGRYADCAVTELQQRALLARIVDRGSVPERTPRLVVVQALAKADRGTLAVELLTEIGVDEIVPWQAAHSVARWDGKEAKARERWVQVAREAAKQSRRTRVPRIGELVRGARVAERCQGRQTVVLHESATEPISDVLLKQAQDEVILVVGPEGGIAADELDALRAGGAHIASLGPEVLRTSTAGVVGATWASIALGRWKRGHSGQGD